MRRDRHERPAAAREPASEVVLRALLEEIDGAPFGRYRRLVGRYRLGEFTLTVDRVPPDPFAGAARIRMSVPRRVAALPDELVATPARRLGVEDRLARSAAATLERLAPRDDVRPGSGRISIERCGPAVLERGACRITADHLELRLFVDLPAARRRIRGRQAAERLCSDLPRVATSTLLFSAQRLEQARLAGDTVENHAALQAQLEPRGLVAFVADGSQLARAGGDDPGPRRDGQEVGFRAPESLRVTLELPHGGALDGLGIPGGVTVIVGGAFHGKSTLLDAIAAGVRPHPAGDGRERVATRAEALVVHAEDGRAVRQVDISGFLGELPSGVEAACFTTEKASGSTSQASSIVEGLEVGVRLLLLDEDRCATNFMIRDGRMQRLVPRPAEPIVPFIDRVRELYQRFGVSTVLVTGGSGDYLEVADTVIRMDAYRPRDATARARQVAAETRTMRLEEPLPPFESPPPRAPGRLGDSGGRGLRTGLRGPWALRVDDETLDLRALEQITETGELRALARLLRIAAERMDGRKGLRQLVEEIDGWLDRTGLDGLDRPAAHDLARPRRFELAAALNRWRRLRFRRAGSGSS